ncbi:MAG: hypothetical protein RH942_08140 [Kiloniellaceae bacterium]
MGHKLARDESDQVKPCVPRCLAVLFLVVAAPTAQACQAGDGLSETCGADSAASAPRKAPRIIFGQNDVKAPDFENLRPMRRSDASSRQAYFGSGEIYSSTLEGLRQRLRDMESRRHLEQVPLSPAQGAARNEMPPALMRALALAKQERDNVSAVGEHAITSID